MKKNTINILLATGIYPPDIGGPATYVRTLEEKLPDFGFDVRVISYGIKNNESGIKNNGLFIVDRGQNVFFRYLKYFREMWRMRNWIDIVYLQGPISEGVPAALFCRLFRKKYVLKVVGDYAWEQGRQRFAVRDLLDDFLENSHGFRVGLFRFLQYRVARGAERIITPSEYLKKVVSKWGISDNKIQVIYNSVPALSLDISKKQAREELGLSDDIIMTAGRLVSWKGFFSLITLMPELLKVNNKFRLIIVGNGPDHQKLESRIIDLKLKKFVRIITGKNKSDVLRYMRAADMFVLNTGYEGLSHVLIEAMQIGVPIVTTRVGGNGEVVRDGESGILLDYDDKESIKTAILDLWHNPELGDGFVRHAKEGLSKFSEEKMIFDIVEILRNFVN